MSDTIRRRTASLLAALAATLAVAVSPGEASAQDVHLPRVGQQFFSVGGSLQPGFLYDRTSPNERRWNTVAPTGAGTLRGGFHQILSESLIMSAEVDVGLQWLNEHTAHTNGRANSEFAFGWQAGILGRWMPAGERAGWAIGAGPHWYNLYLADQPLQSLGVDLRAGHYIWESSEEFVLLELGYSIPLIQGLKRDSNYAEESSSVPKNWTFHRFSISIQYGF
jgi:hypothetical protein